MPLKWNHVIESRRVSEHNLPNFGGIIFENRVKYTRLRGHVVFQTKLKDLLYKNCITYTTVVC